MKNIVIFAPLPKCDCCSHICETQHKVENVTLCGICKDNEVIQLNKEWDEIDYKIENGLIDALEGQKRQSEIILEILDLEFEW